MALTEQQAQFLFANYNNISNDFATEFVEYVFSLVPGSGGTITGDLTITGNLEVQTDFTLDGQVMDNIGPTVSWDFNVRKGYDSGGSETLDYNLGILGDGAFDSLDWINRIAKDAAGASSVGWNERMLRDVAGDPAINWASRLLRNTGGATIFDWENLLLHMQTGGIIDFGTASQIKKSAASNGIGIVADTGGGSASWVFGQNAGELRASGDFDGGAYATYIASAATGDNCWQRAQNEGTTKFIDFGLIAGNYGMRGQIGGVTTDLITILEATGLMGVKNAAPNYEWDVNGTVNATAYRVGGVAGANHDGAVVTLTVVNGLVTAVT